MQVTTRSISVHWLVSIFQEVKIKLKVTSVLTPRISPQKIPPKKCEKTRMIVEYLL